MLVSHQELSFKFVRAGGHSVHAPISPIWHTWGRCWRKEGDLPSESSPRSRYLVGDCPIQTLLSPRKICHICIKGYVGNSLVPRPLLENPNPNPSWFFQRDLGTRLMWGNFTCAPCMGACSIRTCQFPSHLPLSLEGMILVSSWRKGIPLIGALPHCSPTHYLWPTAKKFGSWTCEATCSLWKK